MAGKAARRQKRLARKRQKRKATQAKKRSQGSPPRSPVGRMRRAGRWPLRECRISEGWRDSLLARVLVSRNRPDGGVAIGVFLVDLGCLGVKNAFGNDDLTEGEYEKLLAGLTAGEPMLPCEPSFARKVVEAGLSYARELGFRPNKDYRMSREIFGDIDAGACDEGIPCGKDGKPFYVSGPDDDPVAVVNKLRAKLGDDGFDFVIQGPEGSFLPG